MKWQNIIKRRISDNERNVRADSFEEYGMRASREFTPTDEKEYESRSKEIRRVKNMTQGINKITSLWNRKLIDEKRYNELRQELEERFGKSETEEKMAGAVTTTSAPAMFNNKAIRRKKKEEEYGKER